MFKLEDKEFREFNAKNISFLEKSKDIFDLFDFVRSDREVYQLGLADEGEGVYVLFIWEETSNYPSAPDVIEVYAYDINPRKVSLIKDPRDYIYYYPAITECVRKLLILVTKLSKKGYDMVVVKNSHAGKRGCKYGEYTLKSGEDFSDLNLSGVKSIMGIEI